MCDGPQRGERNKLGIEKGGKERSEVRYRDEKGTESWA
jgi:hypothetical protein